MIQIPRKNQKVITGDWKNDCRTLCIKYFVLPSHHVFGQSTIILLYFRWFRRTNSRHCVSSSSFNVILQSLLTRAITLYMQPLQWTNFLPKMCRFEIFETYDVNSFVIYRLYGRNMSKHRSCQNNIFLIIYKSLYF